MHSSINSQLSSINYSFDSASRLSALSAAQASATYSYLANSPLVSQIVFTNDGKQIMTATRQYDALNRLTSLSWQAGSAIVASFSYKYNAANQRVQVRLADGSYWVYGYDSLGQVVSAMHYWSDGSQVPGQQFNYAYDDIGNRRNTASGGGAGGNLHYATYTANNLNQYTARDVPGYIAMLGTANANATVSLWAEGGLYAPTVRNGGYYWGELKLDNTSNALWLTVTNLAVLKGTNGQDLATSTQVGAFLAQTPENFTYDPDGNLFSDGSWLYDSWDAENRLIAMDSNPSFPVTARKRLEFQYDSQGRRIQKIYFAWNGAALVPQYTNRYVYDGWNLVGVLDGDNKLLYSFTWGTDLSGTMQGAGGIGGLISITVASGPLAGTYFYCYDGNGNVVALVNAADGSIAAQYEYGPFRELLRLTGPMAKANPIRFSTKVQDSETGFLYYGYRYYNPSTGRWLSRDPIEEAGGLNLYCFGQGDPVNSLDPLGLSDDNRVDVVVRPFNCLTSGRLVYDFSNLNVIPGRERFHIRFFPAGRLGVGFWESTDQVCIDVKITGTCTRRCQCPAGSKQLSVSLSLTVCKEITFGIGFTFNGLAWINRAIGAARGANSLREAIALYAKSQNTAEKVCKSLLPDRPF